MDCGFALFLFSTDVAFIKQAIAAGVRAIIVDWEHIGKEDRQSAYDTQINRDSVHDLQRVRACTDAQVLCRINRFGQTTADEVELAIAAGADEVLLPMVRSADEVDAVLNRVKGRCGVGILVETTAACQSIDELAKLPLSRVYVGLNDLAIDRGSQNIFTAVADGTVESIRRAFDVHFGFGGLTLPDRGYPIQCRMLIGEMIRINCSFSFLRRSFHRDIRGRDLAVEIPRLLEALDRARMRSSISVARDRRDLEIAIDNWAKILP
jgi:2-keto-3-deoxy-L-rhamnonate aldolase RhmA